MDGNDETPWVNRLLRWSVYLAALSLLAFTLHFLDIEWPDVLASLGGGPARVNSIAPSPRLDLVGLASLGASILFGLTGFYFSFKAERRALRGEKKESALAVRVAELEAQAAARAAAKPRGAGKRQGSAGRGNGEAAP